MSSTVKILCNIELLLYPQPLLDKQTNTWVDSPPFKRSNQSNTSVVTLCSQISTVGVYNDGKKEYTPFKEKYKLSYGELSIAFSSFYEKNQHLISSETGLVIKYKKLIVSATDVSMFKLRNGFFDKPTVIYTILPGSELDEDCITNPKVGYRTNTQRSDNVTDTLKAILEDKGLEYKLKRIDGDSDYKPKQYNSFTRTEETVDVMFNDDSTSDF